MQRQRIGSLEVSALALGAMPFGKVVDERTSFAIMDRYVEAGGTFLDTSNNYMFWDGGTGDESEEVVGRWLAARGFTVFVLFYRLPGEGWAAGPDVALCDTQRAMRLIRHRARDFAIDPDVMRAVVATTAVAGAVRCP